MPKFISNLMHAQISLLNPLLQRMDLTKMRKLQDALGALGQKVMPGIRFEGQQFDNFDASWALNETPAENSAILYLHGGSYTAGSLIYAKGFGGLLAERTHYPVLCVGYRLAPENPYPAALEDALCAYQLLLERYPPEHISLVGESAGGGLCYCLALRLKTLGLPQPACIVALSPWTDLTMSQDSCRRNAETDPLLHRDGLLFSANMYAKDRLTEPTVSPLFGDLTDMAPSLIIAGNHEILEDDAKKMAERLNAAGSPCELHIEDGMWHVYVLYGIPEAKEALERISAFIWKETGYGPQA